MSVSSETAGSASPLRFRNHSSAPDVSTAYLSTNIFNLTVGPPLHCLVLWLICRGRRGGVAPELFSLNLAACELLWCLCSSTFIAGVNIPALVYVAYFVFALPTVGRPLFHCLICLERYLAVLHPVSFLRLKPPRYRLACAAAVWAVVPPCGVFLTLVLPSGHMSVYLEVFIPLNFIFFGFKLFCLSAVLRALRANASRGEEARLKLRKATAQILIVTVSMLGQYVPLLVLGIIFERVSYDLYQILWCASFVNSSLIAFVNPVLLICRVKKLPWMPDFL